jgi:hypothetical protein
VCFQLSIASLVTFLIFFSSRSILSVLFLSHVHAAEPPSPGTLDAFAKGIQAPFRLIEYLDELKELKDELGYIAKIQASKDLIGALGLQVSLSVLFGITSFIATWIYDQYGVDLGGQEDDDLSPIVDMLGSDATGGATTTFSILQNMSAQSVQQQAALSLLHEDMSQMNQNQQQLFQLLTALLNVTLAGN